MNCRPRTTDRPRTFSTLAYRLASDDSGQDLVEYGLLAGFVGIAGYLTLMALGVDIRDTYYAWLDPTAGTPSLWDPPEPGGGS
jgi:Flp pilus assembly pilin Flp